MEHGGTDGEGAIIWHLAGGEITASHVAWQNLADAVGQ